jgi:plasmid maintenance system antidote protein VapI
MTKQKFQPIHPGEILMEEFLKPMEISQYKLAEDIVYRQDVSTKYYKANVLLRLIQL